MQSIEQKVIANFLKVVSSSLQSTLQSGYEQEIYVRLIDEWMEKWVHKEG